MKPSLRSTIKPTRERIQFFRGRDRHIHRTRRRRFHEKWGRGAQNLVDKTIGHRLCPLPLQIMLAICLFNALLYGQAPEDSISPKSVDEAKRLFVQSRDELGQGKMEEAKAAALRGVKLSPQSVDGYNLLGIIYS